MPNLPFDASTDDGNEGEMARDRPKNTITKPIEDEVRHTPRWRMERNDSKDDEAGRIGPKKPNTITGGIK